MGQGLSIRKFDPGDLALIEPREFESREMALCSDIQARGRIYQAAGPAFTGIYNDEIMACCGIIKLWDGVGSLWAVTTSLVAQKPLAFHRAISYGLKQLRITMGLWRLETSIHEEHWVSQIWIQKLGLKFEGKSPGYGPDKATYIRFGRFYE